MAEEVTKELIQSLALANGLHIPEDRLEVVRRQYQSFLRSLDQIESLGLEREAEPAISFSVLLVPSEASASGNSPQRR